MVEMFKDIDGKVSFSRVSSFLVLLYVLISSAYVVYETKQIPELPDNIYWLILALYGVNKVATAYQYRMAE